MSNKQLWTGFGRLECIVGILYIWLLCMKTSFGNPYTIIFHVKTMLRQHEQEEFYKKEKPQGFEYAFQILGFYNHNNIIIT